MGQYTSYYLYQRYESRDGQRAIPSVPSYYSIDGDGTMERVIRLENDPDCGYVPPVEPIYRWYQLPIYQDYVCNNCPTTGDTKLVIEYSNATTYTLGCDSTTEITSADTWPYGYQHSAITSVEIGDCVTRIGEFTFDYCPQLTDVRISSGVTHIGYGAFEHTNITNLYIPDSVTSIGDVGGSALEMNGAFGHNSGLTEVVIGSGITSIAEYSFDDTPSLTSVTINATTPPTTREWVFGGNVNPNFRIHVPCESVNAYKTADFWNTYKQYITGIGECPQVGHKFDITYMDSTTYYLDCDSTSAITSAETSGSQSKSNIKSVAIGNCVSSIGDSVFNGATSLSSVTIGSGVTSIGNNSFSNCWSLQNINLTSVSTFGYNAFYNCTGMTSVELGSGVTSVAGGAFNINTLTSVTIHAANPPYVSFVNYTGPFYGSCPIYVPKESVEVYKNNTYWRKLGLSSRVQPIGGWGDWSILKASFSDGTSAYTLECGGSTTLDWNTFNNLPSTAMISMVVGECARNIQATSLSPSTFNTLTSVTISSDNLTIGYDVFENFTSISSFTLTTLTPPTLQARPNYSYTMAFDGTNFPILVPCESLDTYKTNNKWSRYASRIHGIEPDCEPQYRTVSGSPYCDGYDKKCDVYSQVSTDGGITWTTTAATVSLIEADSEDCGYVPPTPPTPPTREYLTFIAKESGKFGFAYSGSTANTATLYYSTDSGSTWQTLTYTSRELKETTTINADQKVMWKGELVSGGNGIGTFTATAEFEVEGNPYSLRYGDDFETGTTAVNSYFRQLFQNCTTLTNAENLALATSIGQSIYTNMFNGCTSLTKAPALPATTLEYSCYYQMFKGCTSLTKAPVLLASTLISECYMNMFSGCTSLNEITCLAESGINTNNSTKNWVANVASTGTFYKKSGITWSSGNNGRPSGWTVQDYSE